MSEHNAENGGGVAVQRMVRPCVTHHHACDCRERQFERTKFALEYCLDTLKHHHMTKPGITALVHNTERMAAGPN